MSRELGETDRAEFFGKVPSWGVGNVRHHEGDDRFECNSENANIFSHPAIKSAEMKTS